ncbi:hypothetical protein [Flavobacterium ginsenosidimutans]|uniref:Uncharacterized protein n=1 Tax=Flavobacterium ginsenosidimutans TaxID=687844 RepID=A0ABZ2Q734_9FLAO|nr:hypothetical protein [Flavobacterium ginsenosidimutans]KAF2332904.1 hypothetical protein DM444_08815 [Flavobacterium ginsenosidimutans]
MSWDIVLFNSAEKIISIQDLDEEKLLPIDFDKILLENCSTKNAEDQKNKNSSKDFFSDSINDDINFFFDDEPSSNKMISLYSEEALFKIIELAKLHNWQIFDTSLGEMLDLENPEKNGYSNHKNYVSQIMKNK